MKIMFYLFLLFLFSSLYSFSYHGRVVNSIGDGIPYANILVLGTTESSITDKDGYFGDSTSSMIPLQNKDHYTSKPYIHNNRLYCWLQVSGSSVTIEINTLQGREIFKETHNTFNSGGVSFPINIRGLLSKGVYVVNVYANGRKYAIRYTYINKIGNSTKNVSLVEKRRFFKLNGNSRLSDSIQISAPGYETKTIFATSPDVGEITLISKEITSMKFIAAKDSTFTAGVIGGDNSETPVHNVTFTYDYWIDSTEITQSNFISIISNTNYGYPSIDYTQKWSGSIDTGVGDNYPAYSLSWYDCVLYCNVRSKLEGLDTVYSYSALSGKPGFSCTLQNVSINYERNGYRLPTEAEWEYACRAGTETKTYWGNENSDYYVWNLHNANFKTHPVASKLPNTFGLYDMCGNVKEWCNDYFRNYKSDPLVDPVGPSSGLMGARVVRGGSWASVESSCTSGKRNYFFPNSEFSDRGFRIVRGIISVE